MVRQTGYTVHHCYGSLSYPYENKSKQAGHSRPEVGINENNSSQLRTMWKLPQKPREKHLWAQLNQKSKD